MIKHLEMGKPNSCLNKADWHEPIFVLRAKDPIAGEVVRIWASLAKGRHESSKIVSALVDAERMDKWRQDYEQKFTPNTPESLPSEQ